MDRKKTSEGQKVAIFLKTVATRVWMLKILTVPQNWDQMSIYGPKFSIFKKYDFCTKGSSDRVKFLKSMQLPLVATPPPFCGHSSSAIFV